MIITISKIDFGTPLANPQQLNLSWRLESSPDINGSYTSLTTITVPVNGILIPSYVSPVLPNQNIVLKVVNPCNNSYVSKVITPIACTNLTLTLGYTLIGNCPASYFPYVNDATKCAKELTTVPTVSGTPSTLVRPLGDSQYGGFATLIYKLNKTDPRSSRVLKNPTDPLSVGYTSVTSSFWKNTGGGSGPLFRTMIWSNNLSDTQVGFSTCVEIITTKVYYIGIGADNYSVIKINGGFTTSELAAYTIATNYNNPDSSNPSGTLVNPLLPANLTLALLPTIDGRYTLTQSDYVISDQAFSQTQGGTFKCWNVYPVELKAGKNYIEVFGENDNPGTPAAIGLEIYDATEDELLNATSYADLGCTITGGTFPATNPLAKGGTLNIVGSKVLFSTYNSVGLPVQLGTGGLTCPSSYSLDACTNPSSPICRKLDLVQKPNSPQLTFTFLPDFQYTEDYHVNIYDVNNMNVIVRGYTYNPPYNSVITRNVDLPFGQYVVKVIAVGCNNQEVANVTINLI